MVSDGVCGWLVVVVVVVVVVNGQGGWRARNVALALNASLKQRRKMVEVFFMNIPDNGDTSLGVSSASVGTIWVGISEPRDLLLAASPSTSESKSDQVPNAKPERTLNSAISIYLSCPPPLPLPLHQTTRGSVQSTTSSGCTRAYTSIHIFQISTYPLSTFPHFHISTFPHFHICHCSPFTPRPRPHQQ